jgi:hypothetical protein
MKKKFKLSFTDLKVKSFVTELGNKEKQTVLGAEMSNPASVVVKLTMCIVDVNEKTWTTTNKDEKLRISAIGKYYCWTYEPPEFP